MARKECQHALEYLKEKAETNTQATYSRYLHSQGDRRAQEYFNRARNMGLDKIRTISQFVDPVVL